MNPCICLISKEELFKNINIFKVILRIECFGISTHEFVFFDKEFGFQIVETKYYDKLEFIRFKVIRR